MSFYGLDAHKKSIQAVVIDGPSDRPRRSFALSATRAEIEHFASRLGPDDHVALEATTHAFPIARLIRGKANGAEVVVSNPMKTRIIAESKVKTDTIDALALANLHASGFLPTVWEPDEETARLRQVTSFMNALTRQKTAVKNRIHSILHRNLVPYGDMSDLFGNKGREFLKTVALPESERFQLDIELSLVDYIDGLIAKVKERMAKEAIADEDTLRLMTIPGADFPTALSLKAAIGDITRFKAPKKLVSYIGISPSIYQSAGTLYTGRITKRGRSHARWVLIQSAQKAVEAPGPIRAFFLRLQKKKGRNKAIVAVAAKLCRIIWHMLTKKEDYYYAPPLRTKEKMAKLRVIATGVRQKTGPKKGEPSKGGRKAYLEARKNDHNKGKAAEAEYKKFVANRLKSKDIINN